MQTDHLGFTHMLDMSLARQAQSIVSTRCRILPPDIVILPLCAACSSSIARSGSRVYSDLSWAFAVDIDNEPDDAESLLRAPAVQNHVTWILTPVSYVPGPSPPLLERHRLSRCYRCDPYLAQERGPPKNSILPRRKISLGSAKRAQA